jgi:CheY-like chemotaxis protein
MVMLLNQLHNRLGKQGKFDLLLVDYMFPSMPLVMLQPSSLLLLLGILLLRVLVLDLLLVGPARFGSAPVGTRTN